MGGTCAEAGDSAFWVAGFGRFDDGACVVMVVMVDARER